MNSFQEGYARALDDMGGIVGTFEATDYASHVETAVDTAIETLRHEAKHRENVPVDYLKGWLAEQWHPETLKVSAAARNRNDVWANVPGDNKPYDVQYGDATSYHEAQVKYYKTPESTAKEISKPPYDPMEKVVPSDQLEQVKEAATHRAQKIEHRPEQASHLQDTADRASDHVEVGNASSKPLDEKQAKEMAKDFRKDGDIDADKYGLHSGNFVEWSDVAREAGQAAIHAAIMSAALSAAPHIWSIFREFLETGQIDPDDLVERGKAILLGARTAGLRGGVAAGLTVACNTGLLGQALKGVSPVAIGMATTLTLNAINYSLQLHQGRLSNRDFAHKCLRDTFVLCTGMLGATIGQAVTPIPWFGALAGNIVGSTAGAVVFEGANQLMMGICVESGWTFFGLVKQDYKIPEEVLREAGFDVFSTHVFKPQTFKTADFRPKLFRTNSLNFTPIRRGLIACDVVGYTKI